MELNILIEASASASAQRRMLERVLRRLEPQTLASKIVYAEFKAAEARETELRKFVRSHPDHSYDGL